MMHTIFPVVLNMSITASIVIVVVLLARLLLKRAPKIFSYALWAIVLFRLFCPISLTSEFSLMNFLHAPTTETGRIEYVSFNLFDTENPAITTTASSPDFTQSVEQTAKLSPDGELSLTETDPMAVSVTAVTAVSVVWAYGVAAMLLFNIFRLARLRHKLIGAIPLRDNILLADHIPTPFVMGFFRPKIYLPSSLTETEQVYIIQHEKHHIHRGDHIIKLVAFLAMCVHWFNPFVWLAFTLFSKDMEMSCDEAVIKNFNRDIRADYSSSLLQCSTGKRVIIGAPLAFGEGDTKERIKNIMKYKKPTFLIVAMAIIACISLTAFLSSNPNTVADPKPSAPKAETMELKIENGIPFGKSSTDSNWAKLGEAISPPREWANDDLAGRDIATTLIGNPEVFARMVNEYNGWIVVTYGHGVAGADTYVYKSSDKGETWQQCISPPLTWHVSEVGFINEERLLIGSKLFDGASVILTTDGGITWDKIQTPDPEAELQTVEISDSLITLTLTCGIEESWTMTSNDFGDTWETMKSAQQ